MMTPSSERLARVTKAFMDRGYQHMTMVAPLDLYTHIMRSSAVR